MSLKPGFWFSVSTFFRKVITDSFPLGILPSQKFVAGPASDRLERRQGSRFHSRLEGIFGSQVDKRRCVVSVSEVDSRCFKDSSCSYSHSSPVLSMAWCQQMLAVGGSDGKL